jgi:hypothetical protein
MSGDPDNRRSLEQVLADLRAQYDRTPESSSDRRQELLRTIEMLEEELARRRSPPAAS